MGCEIAVAGATVAELRAVHDLFAAADRRFSRFQPASELSAVNAAAGRMTVVSRPFAAMVDVALWAAHETGGLVDPTVGRAVEAAGYDRDFAEIPRDGGAALPGPAGAWRDVELRGRLLRMPAAVRLDLNGVVKAHTVDAALALLDGAGWVSAGGDLAAGGAVDVALPGGDAVELRAGGLATSGSVRRRWRRGGAWQHHLIDPRSGAPADVEWEQVTVSGASCLDADVAAKAAFVLGGEGPAWLDERGLPGRFVRATGGIVVNRRWRHALDVERVCT